MGEDALSGHYAVAAGMVAIGGGGLVPATVEAWVSVSRRVSYHDADVAGLWMNRTWSFSKPGASYCDGYIGLEGCGLDFLESKAPKAQYEIALEVTSSFFPMTSDGKAPDLSPFEELIKKAVREAAKAAYEWADAPEPEVKAEKPAKPEKPEKITITTAVFAVVDDAVRHASDGFKNTITARQAFYSVRSLIKDRFPTVEELKDSYFTQDLLPRYRRENNTDHWPVINYDARGSASEPHDGRKNIQLSTVGVCNLIRSEPNTEKISAVLFIEKEQFGEIIGPVQNEFDLFLIEAKGQGTIAEKQALKWAADAGLPVFIFSDCDIAGFQISEAIRNGTERFPYPIPSVKRIGLDLEDAHALNLLPEPYTPEQKHRKWLEGSNLDQGLKDFIRHKRFELNHLSTNQMRDLLRRKLTGAKVPKAMPTPGSLMSKLRESAWGSIAERLTSDLEERIRIMRQELDDEIADRVRAFAQAVVDATDPDMLHAETKKTLTSKHYRGGPWEAAFVYTVCDLSIISEPLEAELRKDHQ